MELAIRSKARNHVIPLMLLFSMAFVVYAGSFSHAFLVNWDDSLYVVDNPTAQGITAEHLKQAFTQFFVGNYAPLHLVSYMADYSLWGLRPGGFLFTNLLLHALNGMLFYLLLFRLTRRRALGLLAASIFLLHPVQVESVVWISQRKNVLSMFFFLASLHSYISSVTDCEDSRARGRLLHALSLVFFVLALLTKSVAVILPLVLLLYNVCYRGPLRGAALIDLIPFALASSIAILLALQSQAPEHAGGRMSYDIEGPLSVFYTMLTVLPSYFRNLCWPDALSALYMPAMKMRMDSVVAWSALFAFFLAALGVFLFRKRRSLFFWYALFFIGLLPVSQIVPLVTLMNDRYLYFPLLGAAACYGYCAFPPGTAVLGSGRQWITALLCLPVLALPVLCWQRTAVWKDDVSLWSDVTQKTPGAPLAWTGLGVSYFDARQFDKAADAYRKALSIDPDDMFALNNLGAVLNTQGKAAEARPYLLKVTELFPDYFEGVINLGINYSLSGDLENAEGMFKKGLVLRPGSTAALARLGDVSTMMKKFDQAIRYYEEAIDRGGTRSYLEFRLARVEALRGRRREALVLLDSACRDGYRDYRTVQEDQALDPLRRETEFLQLLKRYFDVTGSPVED
jgi:protein O-mannosyl-transferase